MNKASPTIEGVVVSGKGRGKGLGFPTANIKTEGQSSIESGIYATKVLVKGAWYVAATSVGANMTFGETTPTVEAYLLDFDGDIVGENVKLEFVKRLRGMEQFESVEELIEQIGRDVEEVRRLLGH